jgi:peptide deformylase
MTMVYPDKLTLREYPDPVLRRVCAPIQVFDDGLRQFIQRMITAMELEGGVGLAAPQVGVSARIFVTDHLRRGYIGSQPMAWINPRLEGAVGETVFEEGCLSFPGIYSKVNRHNRFDIVSQDEWGVERRCSLDVEGGDFLGIVVQHELDHLDGKFFVDHLSPVQFNLCRRKLTEMEKAYRKIHGRDGTLLRR